MKSLIKVLVLLIFIASVSGLKAQQQKHFVFIQSENKQPYSVQLNGMTYSSTKSGYLIISQLLPGKYYFTVGFPKNQYPEQKFIVDINISDPGIGYSLKQFPEKGWGLFNIVDFSTVMADNAATAVQKDTLVTATVKTDTARLISEKAIEKPAASNAVAPALKSTVDATTVAASNTVAAGAAAVASTIAVTTTANKPAAVKDTVATLKNTAVEASVKTVVPVKTAANTANKKVIKSFELISGTSVDQIYVDKSRKKIDTIAIFIPLLPKTDTVPAVKKCQLLATEDDFHKIRLDMASATTNGLMLSVAKNYFKAKCYTVEQVKNLGVLFLSEESRLQFFEMAKPFISDAENYPALRSQFINPDWREKFNATVKTN